MKKIVIVAAALCIPMLFPVNCSKKENGGEKKEAVKGIIVFVSGDVTLSRGDKTTPVSIGLPVDGGDRISTAANSLAVIQITDKNIIRISANSVLEMKSIENNSQVTLYLNKGEVAAKVTRLEKDGSFTVKTPTTLAAVRGTEFSVAVQNGQEKVAVLSGKVAVGIVKENETAPAKETIAEEGKTVVVDTSKKDVTLSVRKIEKEEETVLKKVSSVPLLPELNKAKSGDVDTKKNEIKVIESDDSASSAKTKQERITQLIKETPKNIEQIKEVFDHIDELSLYSGKTVRGAILSRGSVYSVLTTEGVVSVQADQIRQTNVIK
jgi:hypothetical protein